MHTFGKFPFLIIPLRDLLIIMIRDSENYEQKLNDIITNNDLLNQSWAKCLITPYYRSRLHLYQNQNQIQLELLQFVKPYVLHRIKKGN